jgi:hypothetical protein
VLEVQVGLALQGEDRAHRLPHHMCRWVAQQIARPELNVARLHHEGRTPVLVEEAPGEAAEGVDEPSNCLFPMSETIWVFKKSQPLI